MELEAKFACRTGGDVQELEQFAITTTTTTFGDIAAHGDRRALHLCRQPEPLARWKAVCEPIHGECEA